MSLRGLTPLEKSAVELGQSGLIIVQNQLLSWTLTGAENGWSGTGTQYYTELVAGDECKGSTAADNTSGTLFFPEVDYFYSVFNASRSTLGAAYVDCPLQCKSVEFDNFSRTGNYDPEPQTPSDYLFVKLGDVVFGKFTRIALSKPHVNNTDRNRIIVTKGVEQK